MKKETDELVAILREIRDTAWQMNRIDVGYGYIEVLAEKGLKWLKINDGQANPRPQGWWNK